MQRAESKGKNSKREEFHCATGMQAENVDGEFRGNAVLRDFTQESVLSTSPLNTCYD